MRFSISRLRPFVHDSCVASKLCTLILMLGLCADPVSAQVNSGSDGHDGAFNPTQSVTIDMVDHPDGIYQYTSVNIPAGVTVTFKPNAKNAPVIWLVQQNCAISGTVDVSGSSGNAGTGGMGGVGGWRGGSAGNPTSEPGSGPGGATGPGSGGSYATLGSGANAGPVYGNSYLLPLLGGSGGEGIFYQNPYVGANVFDGGGGGGGAILIAASGIVEVSGSLSASGGGSGSGGPGWSEGGGGSGGGIRIVATTVKGGGRISAVSQGSGGSGRIRIDTYDNLFAGTYSGTQTTGFQPIIIPAAGQGIQLSIASVGGNTVPASPGGVLANPDLIVPGQQNNPIPVVVSCTNVPLNTAITVTVHPASGADVQATGFNNAGTIASSTATVPVNLPRGGGIIYAKCVSGVAGVSTSSSSVSGAATPSLAETGLTATGERFKTLEITTTPGGKQQTTYVTPSGKRYPVPPK